MTEDAEYVRRKGRWVSSKVLEIYLQEATVATFVHKMTDESVSRVDLFASISQQFWKSHLLQARQYTSKCMAQIVVMKAVWEVGQWLQWQLVSREIQPAGVKRSIGFLYKKGFRVTSNHPKPSKVQVSLALKPVCLGWFGAPPMCKIHQNTMKYHKDP